MTELLFLLVCRRVLAFMLESGQITHVRVQYHGEWRNVAIADALAYIEERI